VYSGQALLSGVIRTTECTLGPFGYRVEVAGAGVFTVSPDGTSIDVEEERGADRSLVQEVLLGPASILALALQDRFCLHASAVAIDDRVVAFLGPSGAGKSTLAALLTGSAEVVRFADDILAIGAGPAAYSGFPQLKLSLEEQPSRHLPESLPLAAVYLLEPETADTRGVRSRRLGEREGMVALLGHTVAARLFARGLLEKQLDFFARLAGPVPVRQLAYPRQRSIGPEVLETVASDLEADRA
jgi:hypothetical protein